MPGFGASNNSASGGGGGATEVLQGPLASLPSPGADGQTYFPSNAGVFYVSNASVWLPKGPYFPLVTPIPSDFTSVNGGSSTFALGNGFALLRDVAHGDTDSVAMWKKAIAPARLTAGDWQYIAGFVPMFGNGGQQYNGQCGIVLRDPVTSKFIAFKVANVLNDLYLSVTAFQNPSLPVLEYAGIPKFNQLLAASMLWLKVALVGGNRVFSISLDGFNFMPLYTGANSNYVTPTEAGVFVNARNTETLMSLYSWKEN